MKTSGGDNNTQETILFVDDEPRVLKSLNSMFRRNYQVLTANSAVEALGLMRHKQVEVVVCDERMPGIRGHELLSTIKQNWPTVMNIQLTGYADETAIRASINQAEVFRYIQKPWNNEELKTVVAEAVACARIRQLRNDDDNTVKVSVTETSVLVLDKDPRMEDLVRDTAHELGMPCSGAMTVSRALEMLIAQPGIGILIVDTALGGSDAVRAVAMLRNRRPELVVVVASAVCDGRMAIDLTNSGQIFRYLVKPLHHDSLKAVLSAAAERHDKLVSTPKLARTYAGQKSNWTPNQKSMWGRLTDIGSRLLGRQSR